MDQAVRNRLRNVVTQCRRLLEDATAQALQGRFGIYAAGRKGDVHVEDDARMGHLTDEDRALRRDLLDHLEHIKAVGLKPREALEQLVREIAFTHLNRLCAYKMMETRGLIREAVSRGLKSQGFFFYLADHPEDEKLHKTGQQDAAYRNFLDWLGGTLSEEIGVLFNPNDPANRLYPPQRVLDEVLGLVNGDDLAGIWTQDETIGWVYQYFTPKELRDKARKESQAPRNSYELAFRNQFFTPRYVVEFLTDNTLGRIWYEMRRGATALKDRCRYLVRRPREVFLAEGQEPPNEAKEARDELSQEELLKAPVHIPHRPKKDPREIRILDPACGSGHFLLYCFDLLQVIYEEAYDDPDLGAALRKDYPAIADLRQAVPGLILKHNLHGIDIDLRATQIAALALWLRCQRAYQELGLKNGQRPKITRSNIVCAEPMPGETDLLKEFTATLQPRVLGQLVETIFEKMKLAGEAGSLLKIEEEIRQAAQSAKDEYIAWKKHQEKARGHLFPDTVKRDQPNLLDFADLPDEAFLDRVEEEIVEALRLYATQAANGRGFRRRLFAEDAGQGFAFIDLCRERYDVVLMNPPFGKASTVSDNLLRMAYPDNWKDLYAAFFVRAMSLARTGLVGAISSSQFLYTKQMRALRETFIARKALMQFVKLGLGVLDGAAVDTGLSVLDLSQRAEDHVLYADVSSASVEHRGICLARKLGTPSALALYSLSDFSHIATTPFAFHSSPRILSLWGGKERLEPDIARVATGNHTFDDERFLRLRWEVHCQEIGSRWQVFDKGGEYQPFLAPTPLLVYWADDGHELRTVNRSRYGTDAQVMQSSAYWFKPGLCYSHVSSVAFGPRILPAGVMFASESIAIIPRAIEDALPLLGFLCSTLSQELVSVFGEYRKIENRAVSNLPISRCLLDQKRERLGALATMAVEQLAEIDAMDETSPLFVKPDAVVEQSVHSCGFRATAASCVSALCDELDSICTDLLFRDTTAPALRAKRRSALVELYVRRAVDNEYSVAETMVLHATGCAFGRWDVRRCLSHDPEEKRWSLLDPIPICAPGMLHGPDSLPAKPEDVPSDYPVAIDWDGILVDDAEHPDDIVRRIREVLETIWKDRAEAVEREACEILGVRELRDYFRKPASGGFWMDHVRRYSKSRRKAPIYWYLRSARGNYGLWLYYHRLDKDILFKALLNYVEPKIRLEEDRLSTLRARREATGKSGREAKVLEKDIDRLEQFVAELQDFRDKLRRAADLHIAPDLNDGVVLNIAPLWELVPWKEAKKHWEALQEGKYDWAHIAYQLWPDRVKELCKRDRSVAIAHGLEDLCEVAPPKARRATASEEAPDEGQEEPEE